MTHGAQEAVSGFVVNLNGDDSSANVISRAVARDDSRQTFLAGDQRQFRCAGHSECDAIIMDHANISAIPKITANNTDAALIHEAAIGKNGGRPDYQADDAGTPAGGSGNADCEWVFEIRSMIISQDVLFMKRKNFLDLISRSDTIF